MYDSCTTGMAQRSRLHDAGRELPYCRGRPRRDHHNKKHFSPVPCTWCSAMRLRQPPPTRNISRQRQISKGADLFQAAGMSLSRLPSGGPGGVWQPVQSRERLACLVLVAERLGCTNEEEACFEAFS